MNGHSRSARTALCWGTFAFLVSQLALGVAIETFCPILRDPDYVQKATRLRQRLASGDRPAAVVMLGSSRTVYGLDGTSAENELRLEKSRDHHGAGRTLPDGRGSSIIVFNFGLWGAGPGTYLLNLQRLLTAEIRPDLVLVEVLPTFLNDVAGPYRDLRRLTADRLWRRELDVLASCGYPMVGRRWEWWPGWPVPCYTHRLAILNALVPTFLPHHLRSDWSRNPDRSCFTPQMAWSTEPSRRPAALFKAHEEYAYFLQCFHMGGPCPIALRRLLETCRRERIRAALVLMPEGSLFRSWYPAATLRQVHAFLDDLGREFGAPLVDAREWIEDSGFADSHHLLAAGAAQFSRRLGREAILPLLQGMNNHAP